MIQLRARDMSATRIAASTLGVCAGISGLDHGFFEALQGNKATDGLVVQAIGPDQRMWVHGTEEAFTVVPNFLATGILAIAAGLALIVLSLFFLDRRRGASSFAQLGALLFLVGGGVAQVWFVMLGWAVATRIGRPPARLGRLRISRALAGHWAVLLAVSVVLYLIALEIAIAGFVPGVSDPSLLLAICWSSLGVMLVLLVLAIDGGFAYDLERSDTSAS